MQRIHTGHPPTVRSGERGFAIIVTVSILVLLALVAVGLLTLSTVTIRAATQGSAAATARANAKLSLLLALGELQKYAGPDQRVTASGALLHEGAAQPHWTGVWSTKADDTIPAWLVSGNDTVALNNLDALSSHPGSYRTPRTGASGDTFTLFAGAREETDLEDEVRVPLVNIEGSPTMLGRYSWWISDEGTKARVDIDSPDATPSNNYERLARSGTPREPGLRPVDPALEVLSGPDSDIDKRTLLSNAGIGVAIGDHEVVETYFHDLTIGGHGLPINVVTGGTKTDLSILFDTSQAGNRSLLETHLGAVPSKTTKNQATIYDFPNIADPDTFFLVPELREKGSLPVGPNWGNLYNYGQMWQNVRSESVPLIAMNPPMEADLRTNTWAPYRDADAGAFRNDHQHTNSAIHPVISVLQMGFRLSAEERTIPGGRGRPAQVGYQMQLQMKPLIGLWNPHNVKITNATYRFDWALYPYLRIGIDTPDGKHPRPNIWMREHWKAGANVGPGSLDRWFLLETETVDLEPGEIRLFSVQTKTNMAQTNKLVSTWNEEGAFTFDLTYSNSGSGGEVAGQPIIVPAGSVAWYGDLFLEDAQHPATITRYGNTYTDGVSASWITLKGGGGSLHRISDIWQSPEQSLRNNLKWHIPEQVISEWSRTGTTADKLPVEQIAANPYHIGTWRWFSRNATEAVDSGSGGGSQKARAWIDSNPRFGSTNPAWDGSRVANGRGGPRYEGWNFISPLLGASYDDTYDNGPRGRGKIAEGQNEIPSFPEATRSNGRYRGFGGLSTSSSGQTHVPIFDVPRAPLVSLGQLQHAQVARYGFEPGFAIGNSYASLRIPLDQTYVDDFANIGNFRMTDLSYSLNTSLWDDYFFSTIGRDYYGPGRGGNLDRLFPVDELLSGEKRLPNPRHRFIPVGADETVGDLVSRDDNHGPEALAARIGVEGAFNVNSTSKAAWKAVLASMTDFEFPSLSEDGSNTSWNTSNGIRFPRFGHVMHATGWSPGDGPIDPGFWSGYRKLDADELDELATDIVKEVRERGPFRSFADFVNRDPHASRPESRLKGALQSALDNTVNLSLRDNVGDTASNPNGALFSPAITNENEATGFAASLLQSDLLQSLAPILQVRSDYFRIRASGQATDANGKVLATAVCEAYVQRKADYLDPADEPHLKAHQLSKPANRTFGRRFKIVSFRWLGPGEL